MSITGKLFISTMISATLLLAPSCSKTADPTHANAGTAAFYNDEQGFDLSQSRVIQMSSEWSDSLALVELLDFGFSEGNIVSTPSVTDTGLAPGPIIDMGPVSFAGIGEAPIDGYIRDWLLPIVGHVYCIKTQENRYGKIMVTYYRDDDSLSFEWVYQPNGTNKF